jgi:hypothetical protein
MSESILIIFNGKILELRCGLGQFQIKLYNNNVS